HDDRRRQTCFRAAPRARRGWYGGDVPQRAAACPGPYRQLQSALLLRRSRQPGLQAGVFVRLRHSRAIVAFAWIGSAALSFPASADVSKQQCVAANVSGQDLRRQGKLGSAREQFRACTDPSCPQLVRGDCTTRLDELEKAQPTLVFDIKDGSGDDLAAVAGTIDGRPLPGGPEGSGA